MARHSIVVSILVALTLLPLSNFWVTKINTIVPEPYLDEVFHVGQAQTYCDGKFHHWDPKITTPPGLYLITWLLYQSGLPCSTRWMRITNSVIHTVGVFGVTLVCRRAQLGRLERSVQELSDALHTALNTCLFPILFFFSGLYYTDIASTMIVLAVLSIFFHRDDPAWFRRPAYARCLILLGGIFSLIFRQTNVFWVAVFPGAIALIDSISNLNTATKDAANSSPMAYIVRSWTEGQIYDLPVSEAFLKDYFLVLFSIVFAVAKKVYIGLVNPRTYILELIITLSPYVGILVAFGGFIVWNGGVVLGDKTNHVATLHLPQMLYIWPNFMFFSWPLIYWNVVGPYLRRSTSNASTVHSRHFMSVFPFVVLVLLASLIVNFNTIIHPFTLADNRHYVFYVFRILRRHPAIKYLATPVYVLCGWAVVRTLGSNLVEASGGRTGTSHNDHSLRSNSLRTQQSCDVSFVLIWLATTTLCLVTAPLVEPRYIILPWVIWRISIPNANSASPSNELNTGSGPTTPIHHKDHRLWMETAWFCIINFATGYTFLYRGFAWPQEVGKIQRFLW